MSWSHVRSLSHAPLTRVRGLCLLAVVPLVAAMLALVLPGTTPTSSAAETRPLSIRVLSNRADLISGGDALVAIPLPQGVRASTVRVHVGTRNVTGAFAKRANGRFEGRVTGLRLGRNLLRATAPGYAGRVVVTNHPNGGPVFSGPQTKHYVCPPGTPAGNRRTCDRPATYELLYKSSNPLLGGLRPYDAANPPYDVTMTTTDRGVQVPFIVRQETGFQGRDEYKILTLFQPGKSWQPWAPQKQWNHKVLITHGGGCGASYTSDEAPLDDYSGTIPAIPGIDHSYLTALSRGFAVLSTALDNTGHNCNVVTQAESLVMAKERLIERYGTIRYTIGTGCSGGSIAQQTVANAYPGIYQGLVTTCSYPDSLTAGAQFFDYHLMRNYFEKPNRWDGVVWLPTQMAAVEGHLTHLNAITSNELLFKAAFNPENPCPGTRDPIAGNPGTRFDAATNPGGLRCSVLDMMINPLGPRPKSLWSSQEKAAGRGFAGIPLGNVGVQYGLRTLRQGTISKAQFIDLNAKVGGLNINARPTARRLRADAPALGRAYRTGLINSASNLDSVAMINHGGADPGLAHDYAHAYWMQARLEREQGNTRNRVMWFGQFPLIGDPRWATEAMLAMDGWLAAVEKDHRSIPLSAKIRRDRPATLQDRCTNLPLFDLVTLPDGTKVCEMSLLQTRLETPRIVAGDNETSDRTQCTLKPLVRSSYQPIVFSDAQWARLMAIFPTGVCDWSKPGRGQQDTETWLRYADADGHAVYGGAPLPARPQGSATGWTSPSFRSLLNQ